MDGSSPSPASAHPAGHQRPPTSLLVGVQRALSLSGVAHGHSRDSKSSATPALETNGAAPYRFLLPRAAAAPAPRESLPPASPPSSALPGTVAGVSSRPLRALPRPPSTMAPHAPPPLLDSALSTTHAAPPQRLRISTSSFSPLFRFLAGAGGNGRHHRRGMHVCRRQGRKEREGGRGGGGAAVSTTRQSLPGLSEGGQGESGRASPTTMKKLCDDG